VNQQSHRTYKCYRGSPENHQQRALPQIVMNLNVALGGDHKRWLILALGNQAAILISRRIFHARPADQILLTRKHHELAQAVASLRRSGRGHHRGQQFALARSFGQTGAVSTNLTGWTQQGNAGSTQSVIPETYTALDNLQWTKGKHAMTMGFTYEWQQTNVAAPVGPSGLVQLPFNSNSTVSTLPGGRLWVSWPASV